MVNANNTKDFSRDLVERYGAEMVNVAASYNQSVWTSAHDTAFRHPELYRDDAHPGFLLVQRVSLAYM